MISANLCVHIVRLPTPNFIYVDFGVSVDVMMVLSRNQFGFETSLVDILPEPALDIAPTVFDPQDLH